MKKHTALLTPVLIALLALCTIIPPVHAGISRNSRVDYAVIIGGSHINLAQVFSTTYFVEWVLIHVFGVPRQNIVYLVDTSDPQAIPLCVDYNGSATYANVRYYIGQWLACESGNKFVYVFSHGGGFDTSTGELDGGRWDAADGDEGSEHLVNGTWRGVDENIKLETDNSWYWDDDFRQDVSSIQSPLTVVLQTCKSANDTSSDLSCYSGGFIDDLSSNNSRTIITSSNETGVSWTGGSVADFTYHYMTAFSNYTIVYDGQFTHFDYGSPTDWPYKSWRGAFEYALQHDRYYLKDPNYQEFPWFDDDGNGLPTFINNTEVLGFPENALDLMRWLQHDINYDGIVDIKDVSKVAHAFGTIPGDAWWDRQADVFPFEDWLVDIKDVSAVSRDFGKKT